MGIQRKRQQKIGIHSVLYWWNRASRCNSPPSGTKLETRSTGTATSAKSTRSTAVVRRGGASKDKNFIGLTQKVFSVLEAFNRNPSEPVALEEITRSVGIAKTTVHRLLYSLKKIGYIDQHENGRYFLSYKFYQIGRNGLPHRHLTEFAKPVLNKLVIRTGESAHMGVLENGLILFVAVAASQHAYRCAAEVGDCNYAHSTALGKCILAHMDLPEIDSIIAARGLPRLTSLTITDAAQLALELEKVRNQGYAISNGENTDGVICVAAPVLDSSGKAIAAVSISGPYSRIQSSIEGVKQAVRQETFRLSMLLGYKAAIPDGILSLA